MYKYSIELPFKVDSCINCTFRRELIVSENVESIDKLTGITSINRRLSHCMIKNEQILINELVEGYNSKCPLKGNIQYIPDKEGK